MKKKDKTLSNDELVMEKFNNQNFRFFYQGMPLKEYCEKHPEISYSTIKGYISRKKAKYPNLTDIELIEKYLQKSWLWYL